MQFTSTRNKSIRVTGAKAIVQGLSSEGGLFVPLSFPRLTEADIKSLINLSYAERAAKIIGVFLPELKNKLLEFCTSSYSLFEDEDAAPVVKLSDNLYMLELWHGPTYAFKDVALTLLPHLLVESKRIIKDNSSTLILVATSGDTGKAALEGFKNVAGTKVVVLYPEDGVSALQKLQMQTTTGSNVSVIAIKGNFDDAQSAVKQIFTSNEIAEKFKAKNIELSSANSINFGRLVPQVVYYISSYVDMLESGKIKFGDKINFCVPTGNFGNILAGYYAYCMGLPINKLICASNKNNVLTDFFKNGTYSKNREFFKTSSPSMDIIISSNLERLIFEFSNRDDKQTCERLDSLANKGEYSVTEKELIKLQELFVADFSTEEEVSSEIYEIFEEYGYIADTHTAVALSVYRKYTENSKDKTPTVIVSTASPYKFVTDVLKALKEKPQKSDEKNIKKLENITALPIPTSLEKLFSSKILHNKVIAKSEVIKVIEEMV